MKEKDIEGLLMNNIGMLCGDDESSLLVDAHGEILSLQAWLSKNLWLVICSN